MNDTRKLLISIVVLVIVAGIAYFALSRDVPEPDSTNNETATTTPQSVTFTGTYGCLPKKDTTGPQTLECALGLLTADGKNYGLTFEDPATQAPANIQTGSQVRITGLFFDLSVITLPAEATYTMDGLIRVETIEAI
jgi:hypothetical protein